VKFVPVNRHIQIEIIEKEDNFFTDKKTWGAVGVFIGLIIKN